MSNEVVIQRGGIPGPGADVLNPIKDEAEAAAAAAEASKDEAAALVSSIADVRSAVDGMVLNFDEVPPVNLYDPSLAVNGQIYSYTLGTASALANSMITGHIPVEEGKHYAFSMPATERGFFPFLYFWNNAGVFLGMSDPVPAGSGAPVVTGATITLIAPGISGTSGGYVTMVVYIPPASNVAFMGTQLMYPYVSHTTGDFDRIRNNSQVQEGTEITAFEPYRDYSLYDLKEESVPDTIQRAEPVEPILDAFTVVESVNIYNPSSEAGAIDQRLINYASGNNGVYTPGMAFSFIPVEPGKDYCIWMGDPLGFNSALPIYCYAANKSYLGIDHTIGGNTGMANPPEDIVWVGKNQVSFHIADGSSIRWVRLMAEYSVGHTITDFDRVNSSIQAQLGTVPTAFQPYAPGGIATLKAAALPSSTAATSPLTVVLSYPNLYVRSSFDDVYDLIQMTILARTTDFTNNISNLQGVRKVLKTALDTAGAWLTGTVLQQGGDDSAPLNYNSTYIGANHGPSFIREVTATAHGKTVQDVGSIWTDGASVKWTLMRVVDANKLWFLSQNLSVSPAWSFTVTLTGNLTHFSGATHTGPITVGSSVQAQLLPAVRRVALRVLLNDTDLISTDGVYQASTVSIVETYEIVSPSSAKSYVESQVGGATQPSFIHSSVAADISRGLTYRFSENGSFTVIDDVLCLNASGLTIGYFGATQAGPMNYTGKQLWEYMPRVNPITNGSGTWDFQAQANISGTFEKTHILAASWTDANNPPDRLAQIVKTAGVPEFGLMTGISPLRSVGKPADRKTLVNDAQFVSAARKQYPKAVNVATLPAGTHFEMVGFRYYWTPTTNDDVSFAGWYRDGSSVVVMVDFHQAVGWTVIDLPDFMNGMSWAVLDKTASVTVKGNGVVGPNGLVLSCNSTYGYAVVVLS